MIDSKADTTTIAAIKFDSQGLVPVIVSDRTDKTILMFAWMNEEALRLTQQTGLLHFYSRSRHAIWKKGETSGESFAVERLLIDCDQDVLLAEVRANGEGNACHTGRRSCFYRELKYGKLEFVDT